jgi:hypothetical protein
MTDENESYKTYLRNGQKAGYFPIHFIQYERVGHAK